jgi:hypothetical protein
MLEGQIDRIFAGERGLDDDGINAFSDHRGERGSVVLGTPNHDGPNVETQGSPTHLNLLRERLCE